MKVEKFSSPRDGGTPLHIVTARRMAQPKATAPECREPMAAETGDIIAPPRAGPRWPRVFPGL